MTTPNNAQKLYSGIFFYLQVGLYGFMLQ